MESSPGRAVAPAVPVTAPAMTVGSVLTVAGILLIFVLFALALVVLLYYFNERNDRGRTSSPSGTAVIRNARGRGVDPEVLRSLPVTVYRAAKDSTEEGVECAVCLAGLEDGEEARFLPRCGHGFHAECIDLWLASHSTCPLCRLTVGNPDMSPAPPLVTLPTVPPEPANYAASVLLGVSDQGALTAAVTTDSADPSPSAAATSTAVLVIEVPESSALATPRDVAAKSPSLARLRSLRRLWSFGRQGPAGSTTPSCSCSGGGGEGADVEQGISVTVGIRSVEAPPLPPEAVAGATPRAAV